MNPADLTATAARAQIAAGRLNPVELMEACIERIAERESVVRAMAFLDPAKARQAAAHATPGPLQGLPVGVKDVLDTADMPTGYNSPIWADWRPRADAVAVAWVREAGAVVLGKTVTTEFATRHPGPTTNRTIRATRRAAPAAGRRRVSQRAISHSHSARKRLAA